MLSALLGAMQVEDWLVVGGGPVGTLALAVVFFLVVTPLGLAARLAGRDRLGLRRPSPGATLWHSLRQVPHDPARPF